MPEEEPLPPKTRSFLTPDFVRSLPRDHEVAVTLCSRKGKVIPGGVAEGDWDRVEPNLTCPKGSKLMGTFHCLPPWEHLYVPGHGVLTAQEAASVWTWGVERHEVDGLTEIKTGLGGTLTVTPNHPVWTGNSWAWADLLMPGQKAYLETRLPVPEHHGLIIYPYQNIAGHPIKHTPTLPPVLSKELGLFLGLIWSDGTVTHKYIGFANSDFGLANEVYTLMETLFHLKPLIAHTNRGQGIDIRVNSRLLVNYFERSLGFTKRRVPACLWRASEDIRRAFLKGVMLGDGSTSPVNPNKPSDLVSSISVGVDLEATISLAYFLATLGIKPRIRRLKQSWEQRNYDYLWQVCYQSGNHEQSTTIVILEPVINRDNTGRFLKGTRSGSQLTRGGKTIGDEVIIKAVDKLPYKGLVYDFHAPDSRLFVGSLPVITHNSHPGGDPRASKGDVLFQQEHKHPVLCTGKPETGEIVCRKLRERKGK